MEGDGVLTASFAPQVRDIKVARRETHSGSQGSSGFLRLFSQPGYRRSPAFIGGQHRFAVPYAKALEKIPLAADDRR